MNNAVEWHPSPVNHVSERCQPCLRPVQRLRGESGRRRRPGGVSRRDGFLSPCHAEYREILARPVMPRDPTCRAGARHPLYLEIDAESRWSSVLRGAGGRRTLARRAAEGETSNAATLRLNLAM